MKTQAMHVAFHLTGRTFTADLDTVDHLALRPALLARYRDLTGLRYDFPIVLGGSAECASVDSLSGLMDAALRALSDHEAIDRISAHARRLEREIRSMAAQGDTGPFPVVWETAAARLDPGGEADWHDSLTRLRAAVPLDGQIVDCDAAMPAALFRHVWSSLQKAKARRFRDRIAALLLKLSDILRADFVRSPAGRTADALEASLGTAHEETFDFDAMARLLARGGAVETLPAVRRRRIERLMQMLESQRFYAASGSTILVPRGAPPPRAAVPRLEDSLGSAAAGADSLESGDAVPHTFVFDSCESAFAAYRERAAEMAELAQAVAVAELEVRGDYHDSHEMFFSEERIGGSSLDPEELALFPDYLVILNEATLTPVEQAILIEMLMGGLPVKVLLQTDDLLAEPSTLDEPVNQGARARQLIHLAISLHDVYAMQASASHLFQYRHRIEAGLRYAGPSLFSVFSGATGVNDLPPYLVAAAAMESRAFPAFTYDPSAGEDWASRFSLDGNPQVGADWPAYAFSYEDEAHQHATADLGFTLVDFIACDPRHGRQFATVPKRSWNGHLVTVADAVVAPQPGTAPSILMVDAANRLHKAVVGEPVMREARKCRQVWRSLQELAGINNSHVERRLAMAAAAPRAALETPGPIAAPAPSVAPDEPTATPAATSDEPYIETPRCTTCNECTGVNNVMFAYNANKQAYIANAGAGTYAQLVEAAESCQVSIIHPGKPRNPDEPGLAELLKRAELFL